MPILIHKLLYESWYVFKEIFYMSNKRFAVLLIDRAQFETFCIQNHNMNEFWNQIIEKLDSENHNAYSIMVNMVHKHQLIY